MYRVVIWRFDGPRLVRCVFRALLSQDAALAEADSLRRQFCIPGGGLHSVGVEEV